MVAVPEYIKRNYELIKILLIPLVVGILPAVLMNKESFCAFILIVMSLYWVTECLPIPITSLLPVILFPMLKILNSNCASRIYFQDIITLLLCGLIISIAIERTGLHERLALKVLMIFGSDPKWLMMGAMIATGFISLWISNVATSSLMLPIVVALVKQLVKYDKSYHSPIAKPKSNQVSDEIQLKTISANIEEEYVMDDSEIMKSPVAVKIIKGFVLSVAFSASTGGAGSLVGSTTNLVLKGHMDSRYPEAGLNFATYMAFSLPVSIIVLLFAWLVLCVLWLPRKDLFRLRKPKDQNGAIERVIRDRYDNLGPISWGQAWVAALFGILVLLWLTRDLFGNPGWEVLFEEKISEKITIKYVSDTTPAMLIVILMFVIPKENIFKGKPYENLMKWEYIQEDLRWDVLLLAGGSLAIAEGFDKSGLSKWLGSLLGQILPDQKEISLIIILIFVSISTELTSNVSTASIFIPIADSLADQFGINPVYLLLSLTVCVSLAYLFPVATPPNALIYGSGYVKITDMFISGIVIKIFGILVVYLAANTWLQPIFPYNPNVFTNSTETIGICPKCACP